MKKSQLVNLFRVVFLLLVFSAFSSSAWGAPTHACGGIHTWHEGDKDYYLEDHKCGFFGSESINNKDLGTITSSSFGIDFVIYNNDENNTYNNGLVGYQIDDATGEWPTLTLNRDGNYGYNGTNYAKYKAYLNISALNLSNGQHTIKFYYRVPHVNNDWYINNSNNNYSFTFTLAGESSEDEDIDVPEMPDGLVCDSYYRKVLFFEDFGVLEKETSRKQNNTVDEKEFVTSYNFVAECKSIKNAGDYAIITNPTWSGCTATSNNSDYGDPCNCEDKEGVRLWYKNCLDHTEGDGNLGGMLQFDCRDGNSKDVLYQRTLKNVCKNTFLNFSAYIKKANTSEADPIKARFILRRGGADGEPIGKKDIDNINLNDDNINLDDGWLQISAMFNTGDLNDDGEITVQLINLAKYGQNGNDILLDDLELSACLPLAKLVCSDGVSVEKTIDFGETEVLTAFIENGILENPYYYWQYKTARSLWQPFFDEANQTALAPTQGLDKMQVKPEESSVQYRVIIANSAKEAMSIASEREFSDDCSIGAITNEVTITTIKNNLELDASITDGDICVDGVDATTLTLTVKNPRLVAVTDVEVKLSNITNLNITQESGTGTYSNGVWTVENLDSKGSASIVLKVSSNTSVSAVTSKEIQSFVSSVDGTVIYDSYSNAPAESKAPSTLKLKPLPAKPTFVSDKFYKECALTGSNTKVYFNTLIKGDELKVFSNEGLTTTVEFFNGATPITKQVYYANQTYEGCTGDTVQFPVTVLELPKLNSINVDKNDICKDESTAKLTYNISGGAAPYKLEVKRTENGVTQTINPSNLGKLGDSSVEGDFTLNPSSDATYKFVKVTDNNGCYSESSTGLVGDIKINVETLEIETFLQKEVVVCADKTIEYSITAKGDNIKYRWFESKDNEEFKLVKDGSENTYKTDEFKLGDNKKYKVEVYQDQDSEVCKLKQSESTVTVQDCSELSLTSNVISPSVCMGGEITLNYTITNNNASEKAKDVEVSIINLSKQALKDNTYTASQGTYLHSSGVWNVGTLSAGATATLSITVKGATVVENETITAYISKSGSTSYDVDATETIKAPNSITVMKYTDKPTLISETYKGCPIDDMLDLETQIATPADKTKLKFYTTETGTETATYANKKTEGTTSYWVTNIKAGECESPRTKLDIVVYPQPTAVLSGDATICNGGSANLLVTLSGEPSYTVKLSDGSEQTLNATENIPVSSTSTTTYTLLEVKDGHGCYATLSGSATITVNDKPAVEVTQNPTQNVCDGDALTLPSVSVDANGSTVTSTKWYFNGKEYNEGDKVEYSDAIAEQELTLEYEATNSCGSTKVDAGKFIIRPRPELVSLEITDDDNIICEDTSTTLKATFKGTAPFTFYVNGEEKSSDSANWSMTISEAGTYTISSLSDKYCAAVELTDNVQTLEVEKLPVVTLDASDVTLNCNNPSATITASGAKTYEWSYNDQSGATQTKTGETLDVQLSASASGKFTTTYIVYGYSEKAKCKSAAPVTVKVTENKRKPEVKTLISATSLDETIEGYKETKVVTCEDTELFIKATIVDNVQVGYTAEELTYDWTYSEDGDVFEAKGTGETISTTTKGFFRLVVTDKETGCTSEQKIIEITENLAKPVITYIESYETLVPSGTGIKENDVLTCAKSVIYLNPTIESENEVTYKWTKQGSDNVISTDKILEVDKAGVYTLEVTDKTSFCSSSEVSFTVTENKRTPVISEIISANAQEETVEGYKETTVITCKDSELFIKATVVDNVAEGYSPEELTYDWTVSYDDGETFEEYSSAASISTTEPGIFRLTVKDKATGCTSAQATITITQDLVKPTVELKTKPQQDGSPMSTELNCRLKSIPVMADTVNTPVEVVKFEWSNGASTNEFNDFTEKGTYIVTVTGENGCTASSTLEITENIVKPIPSVDYIGSRSNEQTTILNCNDQYIKVTPSVSNLEEIGGSVQYFWYQDGDEYYYGETLDVSESGKYLITAVGANNCEADIELELTMDIDTPDASIKASADTITCSTPDVELTVETDVDCTYFWTGIGNSDASAQTITVSEGGTYSVFVQSNVNGCMTTLTHTLEQRTDLPTVTVSSSQDKVTCIANTLTASGASTYVWSSGEATESIEVTSGGTYTVTGTNEYGCENTAEIILEEDQVSPEITLTADTTHITCRKESVILTAEVENADASRAYSYEWAQGSEESDVTTNTFEAEADATYKVTVTDTANACTSEETIVVNENKQTPTIVTQSLTAVCLPAAVDIAEALSETNADAVKYYADKDLTQEVTNTSVEAASGAKYYVVGYEVDNNGCVSVPVEIALNVKPVSAAPVVNNYDACAVEGTKTLSSLVTSDKTNLVFFADATSEEPIADEFDASAENTSTTYWVINTAANSCVSERVEFTVDIAGYIDFTIEASETRVPAGNDVTITVTPLTETPVNQYIWYRNDGEILSGDETTLTEQLYLTSKYAVQAIGRCNSPKQEVDIEAVWPTAFTPHNDNGKNDDFAKGMPIIVFNRFYTKIFEGPDGWDGTINGTMNDSKNIAVPGVYYYKVDLPNGEVKKGTIEIVR